MDCTIRFLFRVTFCVSVLMAGNALAQAPHTHEHRFSDADSWAKVFDDPERDRWQKPHEVIMALKLAPDAKVADIGAGTGYFAARLAHMAPNGRIYAVDLEPDMVKYLAERAKREGFRQASRQFLVRLDEFANPPVPSSAPADHSCNTCDRVASLLVMQLTAQAQGGVRCDRSASV